MPELPEVEIIKLFLAQNITGLKIESIEILNPKSFIGEPKLLEVKKIKSVERRAKVLIVNFHHDRDPLLARTLLIHLKMSGQLILVKSKERREKSESKFIGGHPTKDMFGDLPNKSTRVIFNFSGGSKLFFNDQRKFGWIKLMDSEQVKIDNFLQKLGPEPLDKGFTMEVLKQNLLKRKNSSIKVALLDQTVVAGIGNIYASEACFLANIHPGKKVAQLSDSEFKKLYPGILRSLQSGIKFGGSSKTHFTNPEGKKGTFLDYAYVYGREKIPCKKCRTPIKKIKLGGRGTFYCPQCQVD